MARTVSQRTGGSEAVLTCGQIAHDLLRTATDGIHPNLSINALDAVASHIAEATQYLHGFPRTELHHLTGLHLQ